MTHLSQSIQINQLDQTDQTDQIEEPKEEYTKDENEKLTQVFLEIFVDYKISEFYKFVLENPNEEWDYTALSKNPQINFLDILGDIKKPWVDSIFVNSQLTMEFILRYPLLLEMYNWDWVVRNPSISLQDIKAHPEFNWNLKFLSLNPSIQISDIKSNPDIPWNYYYLSSNPNLTIEFLLENLDKNWGWDEIAANSSFNPEDFIKNNLNQAYYNDKFISLNLNLTPQMIKSNPKINPKLSINYWSLSLNPNITLEFVKENKEKPWNYNVLIMNKSLKLDQILLQTHMLKEDYKYTLEFNLLDPTDGIFNRPESYWSYDNLSLNPSLRISDIKAHPEIKWNYKQLSYNHMEKDQNLNIFELSKAIF